MRKGQLCPGPKVCPYALMEEPRLSGPEPLPCFECPALKLEEYLESASGQGMSAVIDLDFAIQCGIKVTLPEISWREFALLRMVVEERNRYEVEQIEKQQKK